MNIRDRAGLALVWQAILAVLFALAATAAIIGMFLGSKQVVFLIGGVILLLVAVMVSGNQRLFCLWGLILTAPLGLSKSFMMMPHMGGASAITIDGCDPFLVALLVFILRDYLQGRLPNLRYSPLLLWWGGMIALGMLDVAMGPLPSLAVLGIIRMLKAYLLFFVIINEVVRIRHFLTVFAALTIDITIQSAVAIIQYLFKANLGLQFLGEPVPEAVESATEGVYLNIAGIFRAGGLFTHPNLLAGFLAILVPICIAMLFSRLNLFLRLLVAVVVALGLMALVITLSRSGWLSFATGLSFLLALSFLHRAVRQRYLMARALLIISLAVMGVMDSSEIVRRFTESDPGALNFRYKMMDTAWGMIESKPILGLGLNTFVAHLPEYSNPPGPEEVTREYGKNWPVVHNSYLVTWTEQGTAGFALLVGLYLTALWVGLTTARQLLDDRVYAISLGATCGIFAIMVDGYASFFIDEPAGLRVFWIVLALIFAAHYWTLANRRMRRATASRAVLRHVAAVST